jgi:hypothetical protein
VKKEHGGKDLIADFRMMRGILEVATDELLVLFE